MDCSTMQISPRAMSSRDALLLALPKRLAVASIGKPDKGCALISPISRLILVMSPCMASAETCLISSVLSKYAIDLATFHRRYRYRRCVQCGRHRIAQAMFPCPYLPQSYGRSPFHSVRQVRRLRTHRPCWWAIRRWVR